MFYIRMDGIVDFIIWKYLVICLFMWDLDVWGFYNGMWRFWFKKNYVIVVGCLVLMYCIYKLENLEFF